MPIIYIDGKKIEVEAGKTIIEAAYQNGMDIPHFCWHPELSVAGNCRMCLVEVGMPKRLQDGSFEKDAEGNLAIAYMPKLQIACATPVADGMYVRSKNEKAVKAQEAVMEFLLINHPLDCPICDEAGQCKLQEYAFNHSKGESRFEETKNHKDKRVVWGPNVLFDGERCISCSRCIRFSKEVPKQNVLSFVQRGDKVTIKVADGSQLDNNYSMNVIDICPVGALTSPDFRFKSRVWDMSFNETICTGCSRGCNVKLGVRNNEILRVEPDANKYVNGYWMCDHGRLAVHKKINTERVLSPFYRLNGEVKHSSWDEVVGFAADRLKKYKASEIMVVASGKSSLENNYALLKFAKSVLKTSNIDYVKRINESFKDDLLRTNDNNANATGLEEIGIKNGNSSVTIENLIANINNGHIKALYLMDEDFDLKPEFISAFKKLDFLLIHAFNQSELTDIADVVFASSTFAESEGTFVNVSRRVQHFTPALVTKENLHRMGMKMSRLDTLGAPNDRWTQKDERNCRPAWRVISSLARLFSFDFGFTNSEKVFAEISNIFAGFKGMDYDLLDKHKGVGIGKSGNPDKIVDHYESHYYKPN